MRDLTHEEEEMRDLTHEEAAKIGRELRAAKDGNLVVGSFAAELVGESYPFFSKAMCAIVFEGWEDEALGRRFVEWCGEQEE